MNNDTTTTSTTTIHNNRPWVERYRPQNLSQVSHQTEVVQTLQTAVATGRLPHLLLYGPPGSGKTSVALALCRQLWHPTQWRRRVLELNASDERGISVVRDKIKHFASLSVGNGGTVPSKTAHNNKKKKKKTARSFFAGSTAASAMSVDNEEEEKQQDNEEDDDEEEDYPNPPYKIIILDEADTVTPDAQAALRRIIEAYSKITRFILICNYVTRIIEPLASRCAKFRFQALPAESMRARLQEILRHEQCGALLESGNGNDADTAAMKTGNDHDDEAEETKHDNNNDKDNDLLGTILQVANGDMRRAVTTLQSAHALMGNDTTTTNKTTRLTTETICEIAGLPSPATLSTLMTAFLQPSFDVMERAVQDVLAQGYSAPTVLIKLLPLLLETPQLAQLPKANVAQKWAQSEHAMVQGADEYLQLLAAGSVTVQAFVESQQQQQK